MRLVKFYCKEGADWKLDFIEFGDLNLVVGANASGKSKMLRALGNFVGILTQSGGLAVSEKCVFGAEFLDGEDVLQYSFSISGDEIHEERLKLNGRQVIVRNELGAVMQGMTIAPPKNKLIVHIRRDTRQYPTIEKLMQWAEHFHGVLFNRERSLVCASERLYELFVKLLPADIKQVLMRLKELDFHFESIRTSGVKGVDVLLFQEVGCGQPVNDEELSTGLLRTVYLLVFMEGLKYDISSKMLVVDDFCEGLDYIRATKLGKMLFAFCRENQIQLIVTSNDNFLMNVVSIDYWNILKRDGSVVWAISKRTHPDKFEEFSILGLNNFDLYSSDFIDGLI